MVAITHGRNRDEGVKVEVKKRHYEMDDVVDVVGQSNKQQ